MSIIKNKDDLSGYGIASDDKQATLVTFSDRKSTDIFLPEYINGVPLRKIGFGAFKGCENIQKVVIPDTVKTIENSAFRGCPNLTEVIISNNAETIAAYAFENCKNLKKVRLPSRVRSLTDKAFQKCYKLTDFIVVDMNKNDGSEKRFVVACQNEHRRFGFMSACLIYFDTYSMRKYDEGYSVIQEFEDLFNIAEYRLFNPEQLSDYMRKVYENAIRMFIPKLIQEDQVARLTSAGELGIIKEERINDYLEMASEIKGSCMAYLLEFKENNFSKNALKFEL